MQPRRLAARSAPRPLLISPLLSLLLLVLLSQPASARRVLAPPGNSGVEQYVEIVPGPEGNEPVGSQKPHKGVLSPSERTQLKAAGSEARALQAFAEDTGAQRNARNSTSSTSRSARSAASAARLRSKRRGGRGSPPSSTPPSGTPPGSAGKPLIQASAASSSRGLGLGLPIALSAIALLSFIGYIIRRRMKSS